MQKDGEPSVEDILRSIKKVISRDDETRPSVGYTPSFAGSRPFAPREAFQRDTYQGEPYTPPEAPESLPESPVEPQGDLARDDESDVYDLGEIPVVAPSAEDADDTPPPVISLRAPHADNDVPDAEQETDSAPEPADSTAVVAVAPEPGAAPEAAPELAPATAAPATAAPDEGLIAGSAAAMMRERLSALSSLSAAAPKDEAPAHPLEDVVRDMLRPLLKDWLDTNLEGIVERMVQDEITRITGRR